MKKLFCISFVAISLFTWTACQKDSEPAGEAAIASAKLPDEGAPGAVAAVCCNQDPFNVVADWGFGSIVPANLYTVPLTLAPCNNLRPFNHVNRNPNWFASPYTSATGLLYNTPQVPVNNCNNLQLVAGGCDNGSISFWGNRVTGESVTQNGINFTLNKQYKIKFNARVRPGSVDTAYICMRFSNTVPSGTTDVRNIPAGSTIAFGNNSAAVRSTPILSQNWECYTMPVPLTANLQYNTLHIYPVNNLTANLSWAIVEIDNIQVY